IMRAPTTSPSHQVIQTTRSVPGSTKPPAERVVTPTVALIIVLKPAARTANLKMFHARSIASRPPAKRLTRKAPQMASAALPVAIPTEVAREPAVVRFAAKAPSQIAGQVRNPSTSSAARAIPVAGQTGLALGLTYARRRPSLAARKYVTASASQVRSRRPARG